MREIRSGNDPDFAERMMLLDEQDACSRVLIPHLSDARLLERYRQMQKEDALDDDMYYFKLLHLEFSARIFERLLKEGETKKK